MLSDALLLGIDGGGTRCRARICSPSGVTLGEGTAGPANIHSGLEQALAAVFEASDQCVAQAGLSSADFGRMTACLALAGASEPAALAAMQRRTLPFRRTLVITDAQAACVGAHQGRDGGVVVVGTGTVGWAELAGRSFRVGGWGLSISDEGSGAWLGREALRRVLWAHDGRIARSDLLHALFRQFDCDPQAMVRFSTDASPRDFGALAPIVVQRANQRRSGGCRADAACWRSYRRLGSAAACTRCTTIGVGRRAFSKYGAVGFGGNARISRDARRRRDRWRAADGTRSDGNRPQPEANWHRKSIEHGHPRNRDGGGAEGSARRSAATDAMSVEAAG